MKNRAKCKLCQSIIESFHSTDYVLCKCGEIAVDGGESLRCEAKDFNNFLRVDDKGNEIVIKIQPTPAQIDDEISDVIAGLRGDPNKLGLIKELDDIRKRIESLPKHVMYEPVTHADFCSLLLLLSAILRS